MIADCLSRLPLPTTEEGEVEPDIVAAVFMDSLHAMFLPEFTTACEPCPELTQLQQQIQKDWLKCRKNVTNELASYFNVQDELAIDNALVMRGTDRFIVPTSLCSKVIDLAHEGHQGVVRTKQRLRELYWWPQMDKYVPSKIASYMSCQ